jgi:hypothetical protein
MLYTYQSNLNNMHKYNIFYQFTYVNTTVKTNKLWYDLNESFSVHLYHQQLDISSN